MTIHLKEKKCNIYLFLVVCASIMSFGCSSLYRSSAADKKAGWPEFSWETVPVCLHFGKTISPLTEEELKFVADICDFTCLEKGHGQHHFGSTEMGIAHDAKRLKALNPKIKVLFYWNTFLNYPLYDACREVEKHPDWLLRDKDGNLLYKLIKETPGYSVTDTGPAKIEQINLLNSDFRKWWASIAGKAISQYHCDGIFMDAVDQAKRPIWMEQGWGKGNEHLLTKAVIDMMQLAKKEMGDSSILLYNHIHTLDRTGETLSMQYLPYADGGMVEHFTAFHSQKKETIAKDINNIVEISKAGCFPAVKGWPDAKFNWLDKEKMKLPPEQLAKEAREKITFSLACFLVAAQEYSYFCYSWGYRERHGNLVDYPEFHKPLGPPKGPAKRNGWIYTREFEHVSVWVDIENKTAKIDWHK